MEELKSFLDLVVSSGKVYGEVVLLDPISQVLRGLEALNFGFKVIVVLEPDHQPSYEYTKLVGEKPKKYPVQTTKKEYTPWYKTNWFGKKAKFAFKVFGALKYSEKSYQVYRKKPTNYPVD